MVSVVKSLKTAHPELVAAARACEKAAAMMKQVKDRIQDECQHPLIVHLRTDSRDTRLCVACRLEEYGTRWSDMRSWRVDEGSPRLSNHSARIILQSDDPTQFYNMRTNPAIECP